MPHAAIALVVFVITYLGVAVGRLPGLALDRTGIALLGAMAVVGFGVLDVQQAAAAVDAPTLAVLFGMMLLSTQYRVSGLYTAIVRRLAQVGRPIGLLWGALLVSALLSAVLTNDVVCFVLAAPLVAVARGARLPPVPLLLALACGANLGSALTPVGNPQNILIAQSLHLGLGVFLRDTLVPVLVSLGLAGLLLGRALQRARTSEPPVRTPSAPGEVEHDLQKPQALKALVLTAVAMVGFLSPVPAPAVALAVGGAVLLSRRQHTRDLLMGVDWPMLAFFAGLFVVVHAVQHTGWTQRAAEALLALGLDPHDPTSNIALTAALGLLVGNVPAVMLALPFLSGLAPEVGAQAGVGLALVSTFAGNAIIPASVANLIVVEQAARAGVTISLRAHLRVGLPLTLLSLAVAALWIGLAM